MPGLAPGIHEFLANKQRLMPRGFGPLRHALRPVDAGRGVLLQGHDALSLAPLQGFLGSTKLCRDTPLHIAI